MDQPFTAYKGGEPYIFVSYSHKDSPAVFSELTRLKDQGFNIWYDEGIEAGTEWTEALAEAIDKAKLFLFFVTPDSVQSQNCRNELNFAVDHEIPIIAVHLKATNLSGGLSLTLSSRQAILKHELRKQEYEQKLQSSIASNLDQKIIQTTPVNQKKTMSIVAGVAGLAILAAGLIFYNQQPESDAAANKPTAATTSAASATADADDKVDLAAMRSIALLPFANMSASEETGFLADGLSEDVLDNLAQLKSLKVASRSASFQFTGRGVDPSDVGEKLGVSYLLEGSVRQQGETLRITVQLIRTKDGSHVWSKTYERPVSDGFEMQTNVAVNIANIAQSELGHDIFANSGWKQSERFAGIDPIAVGHYLSAVNEHRKRRLGEGGSWDTRMQLLKNAIEVDSSFLEAHVELVVASLREHNSGRLSLQTARPAAHAALNKAMKLDPNDFGFQFQLGQVRLELDLDYDQSAAIYERLLERAPRFPWTHYFLAQIDLREGRTSDALRRLVTATNSDTAAVGPQRALLLTAISSSQCVAGDCERALEGTAEAMKLTTGGEARALALTTHAVSLLTLGRVEEARPLIDEAWRLEEGTIKPERYFFLFAKIGETGKARDILSDSRYDLTHQVYIALGHLALGDIDKTFTSIKAGIEDHDHYLITGLLAAELWNPIRNDPRFDEMLALLDSKVTHTEQYLRDHKIAQPDQ